MRARELAPLAEWAQQAAEEAAVVAAQQATSATPRSGCFPHQGAVCRRANLPRSHRHIEVVP